MQRTPLGDGSIMLARFHTRGNLTKVNTADIEMTPDTSTTISLDELNQEIATQKGVRVEDLAVGGTSVEEIATSKDISPDVPADVKTASTEDTLSDEKLAAKYRADADALFKEATELRKQAEDLSPTKKGAARDTN